MYGFDCFDETTKDKKEDNVLVTTREKIHRRGSFLLFSVLSFFLSFFFLFYLFFLTKS